MRRSGLGGSGNYPPGAKNDPRAPYNQTEPPECIECGGVYREDGHEPLDVSGVCYCYECDSEIPLDLDDIQFCPYCGWDEPQPMPCPNSGMDGADYEESQRAEAAEMKMDAMREER